MYPLSTHLKQGKNEKRFVKKNILKNIVGWSTPRQSPVYFVNIVYYFCLIINLEEGGTEQLKRLITEPLDQYSKLLGKQGYLEVHQKAFTIKIVFNLHLTSKKII